MTKKHFEWAAAYVRAMRTGRLNRRGVDAAQTTENAFVSLFRQFGPRFDEQRFRTACDVPYELADDDGGTDEPGEFVGTCPACRESVFSNEPDGPVWTCPADLSDKNPFHEPPLHDWTEEDRERMGSYGNCLEDVDMLDAPRHCGTCYDRLPLHSACYARGNY